MLTKPSREQMHAIANNDSSYDGKFYYCVKSTGIFCRPSCKSRTPCMDGVEIAQTPQEAMKAGYRPCKRCKSGGGPLPDEDWVMQIEEYIERNFDKPLDLKTIAEATHGSPYHLHRVFKKTKGITLLEYLQNIRVEKAKKLLVETDLSIKEVARKIGINNPSRFSTFFKNKTQLSPTEFKKKGAAHG